jgi:hypothetical protein
MPVDTSRLDSMLRAQLPVRELAGHRRRAINWGWRLRAIAAAILLASTVWVVILAVGNGPVIASPLEIAKWHDEMKAQGTPVTSIDSANQVLRQCDAHSPPLPGTGGEVRSCCLKMMGREHISCAMLERSGHDVMICVAKEADVTSPPGEKILVDGTELQLFKQGNLNIVACEKDGRWVCVSSEISPQELGQVLIGLKF